MTLEPPESPEQVTPVRQPVSIERIERVGVYHKVGEGQTLWRIAKTYNVPVETIARANKIPKEARIEDGQLVFIPGAEAVREIYPEEDNAEGGFIWPVKGQIVGSFHQRKDGRINKGIDIRVREGTLVKAARTGRVVFADHLSGYGFTVILDHLDGLYTVYAGNAKLLVALGELAVKNRDIARVGRNGDFADLHFQVRRESEEDNPLHYLP